MLSKKFLPKLRTPRVRTQRGTSSSLKQSFVRMESQSQADRQREFGVLTCQSDGHGPVVPHPEQLLLNFHLLELEVASLALVHQQFKSASQ